MGATKKILILLLLTRLSVNMHVKIMLSFEVEISPKFRFYVYSLKKKKKKKKKTSIYEYYNDKEKNRYMYTRARLMFVVFCCIILLCPRMDVLKLHVRLSVRKPTIWVSDTVLHRPGYATHFENLPMQYTEIFFCCKN